MTYEAWLPGLVAKHFPAGTLIDTWAESDEDGDPKIIVKIGFRVADPAMVGDPACGAFCEDFRNVMHREFWKAHPEFDGEDLALSLAISFWVQ